MPNDVADWTTKTSTVIDTSGGSVSVTQSGPISITGTVNVSIQGTPAVTISGTPTVTISGNVTFSNTQIAVLNVAGNLLNTNQIPTSLGSWAVTGIAGTVVSQTVTVPTAAHSIQLTVDVDCSIAIRGTTSLSYYSKNQFATVSTNIARQGTSSTFEIPINTGIETSYEVRIVKADGTAGTARAAAVLTTECVVAKTDIGDPLRVASRIDHTQIIEKGETAPAANTWTQIVATSACTPPNQIQLISFGAVNGTGGSTRIFWRIRGSNSGLFVIIYRATLMVGNDVNRDVQYDPVLFWSRLNQVGFNQSDVVIIDGFAQGANCFVDATVVYGLV